MILPENSNEATAERAEIEATAARIDARRKAERTEALPLSVYAKRYYLRQWGSDNFDCSLGSDRALTIEIASRVVKKQLPGELFCDERGQLKSAQEILTMSFLLPQQVPGTPPKVCSFAENARFVAHCFAQRGNSFDPSTGTLTLGYSMSDEPGERDISVEDWLTELAGGNLQGLYDWIAATDQRYIEQCAAAPVFIGPPGIGKSLLLNCVARTWRSRSGASDAVPLASSVQQFNGPIASNPIWFADEHMPKGLTEQNFRVLVQKREHEVELKGQEKETLKGCARLAFAVNVLSDFHLGAVSGADAARAVGDRLAFYTATHETPNAFALICKQGHAEIERIVRHLRWVQTNHTPRAQRFLGGGEGTDDARGIVLRASVDTAPEVFAVVRDYAERTLKWESDYVPQRELTTPGRCYPIVTQGEKVFVLCEELARRSGLDPLRIRNALAPFFRHAGGTRTLRIGKPTKYRNDYREIDEADFARFTGIDLTAARAQDTEARDPALDRYLREALDREAMAKEAFDAEAPARQAEFERLAAGGDTLSDVLRSRASAGGSDSLI